MTAYPELVPSVRALVSLQAPYAVPPIDAYIPRSRLVHLNGVDHGGLALPFCRSLFDPGRAVEALAAAALVE